MLAASMGSSGPVEARRMAPDVNDAAVLNDAMPRTLEEFGFFVDAAAQIPTLGVVPYRLNTPLYTDGADKLRFVYVPAGKQAKANGDGLIDFPIGSALIKTFAFGEGLDQRLIETRVLLHRADGWVALPYRWNDDQTEATLAVAGGRVDVTTPDGRQINYRIPNKNQCKQCHSLEDVVVPIGPKARNLSAEWLREFVQTGHLDAVPAGHDRLPLWQARYEGSLDAAARAYLDVNCAHCHQPGGKASNSGLDLRWEQREPVAYGIRKRPVAAGRGSGGLEFAIAPGDPAASIITYRMNSTDPGIAMPEIGTTTVHDDGLALIGKWIAEMKE
ncbi:hypothetical protein G6N82_03855 [Altererythrobacter sp. BO-6]|nr:SO2930 family diheme c-type cytochrome [Altererythrobacter sp. BO-6]QIG55331.1 hypothetical protein G6N82_03855 [Altererythrobacter sp. BO-6]